jgi:hypothetical protein
VTTIATGRGATPGLTARRYTPADFAEPDRRPLVVRWARSAGEWVAEAVRAGFTRPLTHGRGPAAPAHR